MKIFSVLGYLLCFGVSDCLWVYPNKKLPVIVSMTVRSLITTLLFFILFILTGNLNINWSYKIHDVLTAILISGVSYGGLYCYVNSLKYEQAAVIAPVTSILTSLLGLIFTIVFYSEVLTLKTGCCLMTAFLGIILSFSHHNKSRDRIKLNKGIFLSVGASVLWAISYTFFKTPIDRLGVITFSLILETTILMINTLFFLIGGFDNELGLIKFNKPTITLIIIGFLIFFGTLLSSYSYKLFPLLYLNVLGKLGVLIPILYCTIFLKEKLTIIQIFGIGMLVASAITIVS